MTPVRVADYVTDYLYQLGIHHVFMVSGGGSMFLSDGLAQHPRIKAICNHHEQASAMAAVSYAKYRNQFGAAYLTTGCGGTNAITGLLNAWQDNVRCVFVSGQCKRKETIRNSGLKLRQFGVQEADIITIVESITKYAVMINDPAEIAWHLDQAVFRANTGRPGPVWLDVPLDVQGAMVDPGSLQRFTETYVPPGPTPADLVKFQELLRAARRPIIIAGQGIRLAQAIAPFQAWVRKLGLPVVATYLGVDLLPSADDLFIGRIGNKGDRAGNFALQNADLVISLGSRLCVSATGHEYKTFARQAKVVVVDIDPVEHRKNTVRIDLFIESDVAKFLGQVANLTCELWPEWLPRCRHWKAKWPVCLPEYAHTTGGINLYYFIDRLSRALKPDSVVVSDAGSAIYVPPQALMLKEGQRFITSGAQSEMGYTLPATIGICAARGGREVIGITGDGSLQMNIQELATVAHHKMPVKLFVWNNDGYLSIRSTQTRFFQGRLIGSDRASGVSTPDLRKIADAYGLRYHCISQPEELDDGLATVLAAPEPVVCEVMCLRDQEIIPAVASSRREDGTMVSRPLEDMYPFLDRKELAAEMIIEPLG